MEKVKLTERLLAAARLGEGCRFAVDVGTDHGRLALWLALSGRAERVAATDIRPGPLSSARRAVSEQGLEDRIRLELCDGLDFEGADEADAVYIAGMGGETIQGILERAPWTRRGVQLVLQPQSKLDELCLWLHGNGYAIEAARLAAEGARLYVALRVRGGSDGRVYAEEFLEEDPLLARWLDARLETLGKALDGMESAAQARDTTQPRQTYERLLRQRKEL